MKERGKRKEARGKKKRFLSTPKGDKTKPMITQKDTKKRTL